VKEFDEATTAVFGGKKVVGSVMMDGVEDEASRLPEGITVEKDVWHRPCSVDTMGAGRVVPSGRAECCGVVGVEGVVCSQLESRALERARCTGDGAHDKRV
jgi:hypothetical protein